MRQAFIALKKGLRLLLPPVFVSMCRAIMGKKSVESITFLGQYSSFDAVLKTFSHGTAYHSSDSAMELKKELDECIAHYRQGEPVVTAWGLIRHNFLPTFIAGLNRKSITILDIGGGIARSALWIQQVCPAQKLYYTIYELPSTVEIARNKFEAVGDINYIADISEFKKTHGVLDIAYFGSSLPYFEDYQKIIKSVLERSPEYIVMTDHPMGPAERFVTAQVNMKDRIIPFHVYNLEEMIHFFNDGGYRLILKTFSYYPLHNFDNFAVPISDTRFYNLVFKKK